MAEKRKLREGGLFCPEGNEKSPFFSPGFLCEEEQTRQNKPSPFFSPDFLPEENRPSLFASPLCFGKTSYEEQQQKQNKPSPSAFGFGSPPRSFSFGKTSYEQEQQQCLRQNKPEGNKTINFSPSFCFYGDQTPNINSGNLTINFSPSFSFYGSDEQKQQQRQNNNTSSPFPFPFGEQQPRQNPSIFSEPPAGILFPKKFGAEQQRQTEQDNSELHARIKRREPLVCLGKSMPKQTDFSLSLAKHVISTTEAKVANFVFSPLSMHVVLSMVATGSTGPTRAQFLGFLNSKSVEELNSLASQVSTLLFADGGSLGGPRLSFANGVWVDQSHKLKPAFKEIVDKDYKAASNRADFQKKADEERKEVNSWAEKETNGLIKDLLPPGSVDSQTRLILANALYFKGVWAEKFDASLTKDEDFFLLDGRNKVRAPFMTSRKAQHAVGVFDGFKVLSLTYQQGDDSRRFSMLIYLPDARDGLPALLDKFGSDPGFIQNHLPGLSVVSRKFGVPKFKIGFGFEATQVLKGHGLVLPFSPGGLTEMVEKEGGITSFYHKACIEVDEQGTEASAASACVFAVSYSMGPPPQVDFVADHPFLFVVREDVSGGVLFVGQLLNPLAV